MPRPSPTHVTSMEKLYELAAELDSALASDRLKWSETSAAHAWGCMIALSDALREKATKAGEVRA